MSSKVASWNVIKNGDKYTFVQILEDGIACLSNHRFDTEEQARYWGNLNMSNVINYGSAMIFYTVSSYYHSSFNVSTYIP